MIKPDTRSDRSLSHILQQLNLTNVHKLNSRITTPGFIKLDTQAYHSRCSENYQVRAESLQTFQPSHASSKVKNENDANRNRISDFDKRRISQPKTQ